MSNEWDTSTTDTSNTTGTIPDMDALFEQSVNDADVRQTQMDTILPAGSYVTSTLTKQVTRVTETDRFVLEKPAAEGRLMIRFFGVAEMTVSEKNATPTQPAGTVIRGAIPFSISPDRAFSLKDGVSTGKPDNTTKLYAQAVAAYRQAYKIPASQTISLGDVVRYLENYPVMLRVQQFGVPTKNNPEPSGTPGNWVAAISAVRETGGGF